jgi:hypothetical protein
MGDGQIQIRNGKVLLKSGKIALSCCCYLPCTIAVCQDGEAPEDYQLVVSGIEITDDPYTPPAPDPNQTYIITGACGPTTTCYLRGSDITIRNAYVWNFYEEWSEGDWDYARGTGICIGERYDGGIAQNKYAILASAQSSYRYQPAGPTWNFSTAFFLKTYVDKTPLDCPGISGLDIPFHSFWGYPWQFFEGTPTSTLTAL